MLPQIDMQRLMEVARVFGALSGDAPQAGIGRKEASLSLSSLATMYGCCGLFDMCGSNDLLSLTQESEPFLDWLGWRANNECKQFVKLISYVGPSGTAAGNASTGASTACADAYGVEFGKCEVLLPDKGRIKRAGPVRDLTENNRKVCDEYPVFTKDGTRISDEITWSLTMAGMALRQDVKRLLITGNASNAGEFSGLEALVNTGYVDANMGTRCSAMDSIVLDWNDQAMSATPNGVHNLIDYLIDIIRRIRSRAMWANLGGITLGDQVIMLPSFLRDCLLDAYTCWRVCPGSQYNETNLNSFEARTFRDSLNAGVFGMGHIFVDGVAVPLITYDWQAFGQAAPNFTADIYVLTRRIGNVPVMWGQYIDMGEPAQAFNTAAGYAHYKAFDGGRFLGYWKTDNECTEATILIRPNLYLSAPWAQARIQDVACRRPLNPISPDPTSSYYAEEYLTTAVCPEDYLIESPE